MISTKGRYALVAMVDIAINSKVDGVVSIKDISKREDISEKYLEQVISSLVKARLLRSIRGSNGGYRLVKTTSEYTTGEILRALEGDLSPVGESKSNVISNVGNDEYWKNFEEVINGYVDSVTLETLVEKNRNDFGEMYYI